MGCGVSKESVAHSEPQPVSNKKQSTPLDGECSQLHQEFDCDPEDESASKATKAVNLIGRACSPTCEPEQQDVEKALNSHEEDDCGNKDDEQEQEEDSKAQRAEDESDSRATAAARDSSSLLDEPDDGEDEEDDDDNDGDSGLDGNAAASAVAAVVAAGNELSSADDGGAAEVENLQGISNSTFQYGRDCEQQGVNDILPKAAKAALEAIVKSAEDDIQAHKVAAAMAAVGDILFGAKDEAEMKTDKAEVAEGREAAHIRNGEVAHVLNGEVETDAFPPSGTTEDCSNEYSSPKSGFLFDYCQKMRLNGYKVSSPPSTSISSEGDTISFIQDFLEEIDLTKELKHDPGTPRILFKDFSLA